MQMLRFVGGLRVEVGDAYRNEKCWNVHKSFCFQKYSVFLPRNSLCGCYIFYWSLVNDGSGWSEILKFGTN